MTNSQLTRLLFSYLRSHGVKFVLGSSPYQQVANFIFDNGLALPDYPRPIGKGTSKAFVKAHLEIIKSTRGKIVKKRRIKIQHINNAIITINIDEKQIHAPTSYISSDAFLHSYEWRKLRLIALKLHGCRCQCCGSSPKEGAVMNVDHIKPRKHSPELALDINNLQVLCGDCNHGKGNWDTTDFR